MNNMNNISSKAGFIEYKMPEAMAKNFLADRKGKGSGMNDNEYLCKIVNETFGLKGECTRVILF